MNTLKLIESKPRRVPASDCAPTLRYPHPIRRLQPGLATALGLLLGGSALQAQSSRCIALHCPPEIVAECAGGAGTVVNFTVSATSSCAPISSIVSTPPSGTAFPFGTNVVRTVAKDIRGNTGECSFTVVVRDTRPPEIFVPDRVVVPCSGPEGAKAIYSARAVDGCSGASLTCTPPSGSMFPVGTNVVHCTARDSAGNVAIHEFEVVVTPDCPDCIELTCPTSTLTLLAGSGGTAVATYPVTATNHCGGNFHLTFDPPVGSDLPVGLIHAAAVVLSDSGTVLRRCSFDVVVKDITPPIITCPAQVTLLCQGILDSGKYFTHLYLPLYVKDNTDPTPDVTVQPPEGTLLEAGEHFVQVSAKDGFGNSTTRVIVVSVVGGPKCQVDSQPPGLLVDYNWDFEKGLHDWTPGGQAFEHQPTVGDNITVHRVAALAKQMESSIGGDYWHQLLYPIGHHGDHWIGTAEWHDDDSTRPGTVSKLGKDGNGAVGTLVSAAFRPTDDQRFVTFLISGQHDPVNLRVELLVALDGPAANAVQFNGRYFAVTHSATGHDEERMRRETFDLASQLGSLCRIRIVDNSSTGHLNVDDFRFQPDHPANTRIHVAGREIGSVVKHANGYLYDWDSPIWGLADLHTHPMSHLGLGQKVFHGKPDGDIATALADCGCVHGGWGTDNDCGNYLRQMVISAFDGESTAEPHRFGWHDNPTIRFQRWPLFSSYSHQQMWHEWIRRAYDGGLRVMVALTVHGEVIAKAMHESIQPYDDASVMETQIKELKAFVARHADFMEIAYDPLFAIATKDYMGRPLTVEGVNDGINFRLPSLDATSYLPSGDQIGATMLKMIGDPTAPFRLFVETQGLMMGSSAGLSESSLGFAAVGAITTMPLILGSPAAAPLVPLLPEAIADFSSLPISTDLYPIGHNYPDYSMVEPKMTGHRNRRGLSKLGVFAIQEMMRLGMMIDIDHMSYHGVTNTIELAREVDGGYPLNSGHNSFRVLRHETSENNRTPDQLEAIRELGGLMGLGWGNADMKHVQEGLGHFPTQSQSIVDNNCPGSSRTFAQSAAYAFEYMKRRQVALGSDINGYVVGPGPRFGPQSAFGLRESATFARSAMIDHQENGVAYEPREGRPGSTGVFNGKAVDQSTENGVASVTHGYRYNKQQRDFFVALRIFRWGEQRNLRMTFDDYVTVAANMHPVYNLRRVQDLLIGLYYGRTDGTPGSDILDGDVEARQKIGKAVYRHKVLKEPVPAEFLQNQSLYDRWMQNLKVWSDYEKIYGANVPMNRCTTAGVQWDYNFDGLAHYGLLPDFFQDLVNVEFEPADLSPLFQSAESFAQMWTRCLTASWSINHPMVRTHQIPLNGGLGLEMAWNGEASDSVEESDNAGDANSWRLFNTEIERSHGVNRVRITPADSNRNRFYRIRKAPTP